MSGVPVRQASMTIGAAVPSLVRWRLSCDADLVFRTLATMGARDARELALELGLPCRRIDGALAELRTAGAATPQPSGSRRGPIWQARPPAEVVAALRHRRLRPVDQDEQVRSHHAVVTAVADRQAAEMAAIGGELGDGVRYLPTRFLTRRRLAELMGAERSEHLVINTEQSFDAASAKAGAPLGRQIVERGVRVRALGLPPADQDLHVDAGLFDQPFFSYREAPTMPMKLLVIDRRIALFPADPADLERGYLELSQPGVVRGLVLLFEHHWANATDPREHGVPDIVLTDRERELIALLARGHTDVSAAAQMRVSARLITKMMRALMDRAGVENRFQLGLALGAARNPPSQR
jgi:DNA-binding CsgD family transcriptional regulator